MKKEELSFLNQAVKLLENAELKLEEAYKRDDQKKFDEIKDVMLKTQEKITRVLKLE
jgi:exonuclease VII small subunit